MKYEERVITVKTYDVAVDIDDFIDWLNGEAPSYNTLKEYIEEGNADYDLLYEAEKDTLDTAICDYNNFLEEVNAAIESRN